MSPARVHTLAHSLALTSKGPHKTTAQAERGRRHKSCLHKGRRSPLGKRAHSRGVSLGDIPLLWGSEVTGEGRVRSVLRLAQGPSPQEQRHVAGCAAHNLVPVTRVTSYIQIGTSPGRVGSVIVETSETANRVGMYSGETQDGGAVAPCDRGPAQEPE